MIIGVDPHKLSHTATAVDPLTNTAVASLRVDASLAGYRELLRWGRQFGDRRWAIENAMGLGCHMAQWLVARDEVVFDVATTATSRVRELSRGGRRKNDVIDASAAASVAALQGDARRVVAEDHTTLSALLEERRANLAAQRVRAVIAERMTAALDQHASSLTEVDGIGLVLGVRLIGRTGPAARFPSSDAFASYSGVVPVEVSSGERITHRLSRSGDRQLNSALHLVAVTQVRMRSSTGRRFFDRKIAEGKTRNEAMRCLKRRIAAHVWRRMLADELHRHLQSQKPAPAT